MADQITYRGTFTGGQEVDKTVWIIEDVPGWAWRLSYAPRCRSDRVTLTGTALDLASMAEEITQTTKGIILAGGHNIALDYVGMYPVPPERT
jgi:hypothetical protein